MKSDGNDPIDPKRTSTGLRVTVVRPRDLLALDFQFINLKLLTGPHQLVRLIAGEAAYLIVHFPAQSIAEKAFAEDAPNFERPPVSARMGGPSRLVFKVPDEVTSIPYTLAGLLEACQKYELSVVSDTPGPLEASALPRAPKSLETAIEAPFRLILSPSDSATWSHASQPIFSALTRRIELWHTRLESHTSGQSPALAESPRTVRAIWSRDPGFSGTNATSIPPAYDPAHPTAAAPFLMPLDASDRHQIIHQSSNFSLTAPDEPQPITVNHLMLTSLGAWLDVRGAWKQQPSGFDLEEWVHRSTQGRDHAVRVVNAGCLFAFGHRASIVTVTNRGFHDGQPGKPAYLRHETFVVVQEPVRTYGTPPVSDGGRYDRQMPFKQVRILTRTTPALDSHDPNGAFWPYVDGKPFRFHVEAVDQEGNVIEFTAPMIFVPKGITDAPWESSAIHAVRDTYRGSELRRSTLGGQKVVYAQSDTAGDTRFETDTVSFGAEIPGASEYNALPSNQPRFFPIVEEATVQIPAMKHLTGKTAAPRIRFYEPYLQAGFNNNKGEVFLELMGTEALSFDSVGDKVGGLVKPNMNIRGLSRRMGPIAGDLNQLAAGTFDPGVFFQGLNAKVFGVINLADIVDKVDDLASKLDLVPKFVTQALDTVARFRRDLKRLSELLSSLNSTQAELVRASIEGISQDFLDALSSQPGAFAQLEQHLKDLGGPLDVLVAALPGAPLSPGVRRELDKKIRQVREVLKDISQAGDFLKRVQDVIGALEIPEELTTRFEWRPRLKPWGCFLPKDEQGLRIAVEARVKTAALTQPSFDVVCSLENFAIDLLAPESFLVIHFDRLQFIIENCKKPEVDVVIGKIEFVGVLSFVETLKNLIPLDGFSDPPALEATSQGITASYSLALPNVAVGMFSLENLSLGAALNIPFIGDPLSVRFNFCERDSPFVLTVSSIGGGGFFGITVTPNGVQLLEAAFEFGASLSVNFGVASGSVSIMAGIYFKMEGPKVDLTGYLRIRGEVSVLGIISCALELFLGLSYESSSGKVVGRASLLIEIEVLFFSKTVEISCERKFAGSNGDPTLRQVLEPDLGNPLYRPWDEYCQAFAT